MATCVTWKQPDADHFNGFCTNSFRLTTPPDEVRVYQGCDLCVKPTAPQWGCDDLPIMSRQRVCGAIIGGEIVDTWKPLISLHLEADTDVSPWVFQNPFQEHPEAYYGDFVLKSTSKCLRWVSDEKPLFNYSSQQRFELSFIKTAFKAYFLLEIFYQFGSVHRHVIMTTAQQTLNMLDCRARWRFTSVKFDGDPLTGMPSSGNFYIE